MPSARRGNRHGKIMLSEAVWRLLKNRSGRALSRNISCEIFPFGGELSAFYGFELAGETPLAGSRAFPRRWCCIGRRCA